MFDSPIDLITLVIAIAAFAFRKCADELHDPLPKIDRQRQNGAELNHDGVHFPKTILKIDAEQRFDDAQMRSRAHGQEFGGSFDNPKQGR